MEEIAGKDAQSPTSWRQFRRFLLHLLAISLGAVAHDVAAATYWQVQQAGITVFVQGDKDTAKRVAETTLRLQSAARWLFNWPESHREPPVLIFAVDESLLRRTFQYPAESNTAYTDYTAGHESWARTPSLIVVAASMGYRKGAPVGTRSGGLLMPSTELHDCISDSRTAHHLRENVDGGREGDAFERSDDVRATANSARIHGPLPQIQPLPGYPARLSG